MALGWIALSIFAGFLKDRVRKNRDEAELRVTLGGNSVTLKGFIDTGNILRDPITGRPVCVAAKQAMEGLVPEAAQFCLIPYRSINKKEGLLTGIRPDSAVLSASGRKPKAVNIILAVSKGELPVGQDGRRYDVLLHETLTEGGILQGE